MHRVLPRARGKLRTDILFWRCRPQWQRKGLHVIEHFTEMPLWSTAGDSRGPDLLNTDFFWMGFMKEPKSKNRTEVSE